MATLINLNDITPVAPSNGQNVKWQSDASSPTNVSAYIALGSATTNVLINLSGSIYGDSGFTYDSSGHIIALTNPVAATVSVPQNSPFLNIVGSYWNGSSGLPDIFSIQSIPGSGTNPIVNLTITHSGSSGAANLSLSGGVGLLVSGGVTFATTLTLGGGVSTGGNVLLYGNTPATNVANITFGYLEIAGNYWTGSASAQDYWRLTQTLGTGSNPTSTLTLSHSGTSGVATFIFPTGFGVVQSLSNAPSTSSSTGVAGQIAWDASGYVYICTATNTWVRNTVAFTTF